MTRISSSAGGLTVQVGFMRMARSTACLQYASFPKCAQDHLCLTSGAHLRGTADGMIRTE